MAMTRDEMAALVSRCHTAIVNRDADGVANEHAEDCVTESPTAGGHAVGREAVARIYDAWFTAFPDMQVTPAEFIIDGERAAQLFTVSGTDTGGFMGMPPTGKPFRLPIVILIEARNGAIVHSRPIYDFSGLLIQLGVLKVRAS